MTARFFQIGFNRCGTTSLAQYLRDAGVRTVDFRFGQGIHKGKHLAHVIQGNLDNDRAPLHGLHGYGAFTDAEFVGYPKIIHCNFHFREIAFSHPELKFILNIREKKSWMESRKNFGDYLPKYAELSGLSIADTLALWSRQWDEHIAAAKNELPGERLHVLDIDRPDLVGLADFVGLRRPRPLPRKNGAVRGALAKRLQPLVPPTTVGFLPQSWKNVLKNL